MNTENGNSNESNKLIYQFTDKLNLKTPNNKNTGLVHLSITTLGKTLSQNTTTTNLKFQHPLVMILLIFLMVLIQFLTFKIIMNLSSQNTKL